jgi:hypothetical protein
MIRVLHERSAETEAFNRVLAVWLDLQWALNFRNDAATLNRIPNDCDDRSLLEIWNKLTAPGNATSLAGLIHHLPDGPQVDLVQRALKVSQRRESAGF